MVQQSVHVTLQAKGLGKELGRNTPDASAAADKAKGEVSNKVHGRLHLMCCLESQDLFYNICWGLNENHSLLLASPDV